MNAKSRITAKEALEMTEERFCEMVEETNQERTFEDKALEQFVRKPKEFSLYDKIKLNWKYVFICFLFVVIVVVSIISMVNDSVEKYALISFSLLSIIGMVLSIDGIKREK